MGRVPLRISLADERGMGLVEILIACVVVAIGLVALASAIPLAAYGIQEGNQLSTATFLANARLEQVKNSVWTAASSPLGCPSQDCLGISSPATAAPQAEGVTTFPDEAPVAAYTGYNRQVRITISGLGDTLRQVTVTVAYRPLSAIGVGPATKQVVISTLVAKK